MFRRDVVFLFLVSGTIVFGQAPPPGRSAQPPSRPASATARAASPTCDRLAAHPNDTGKPASVTGVADGAIAPPAIAACAAEVQASPQSARLKFQLGRALWAAKRYDEAIEAFLQAEEMDYAPAAYYLGLAHEQGLIEGEPASLAAAADLYMIAASEGFAPAVNAYRGTEWDGKIDFGVFSLPVAMRMLYENDFEKVTKEAPLREAYYRELVAYIAGVENFLTLVPNEYEPSCEGAADPKTDDAIKQDILVRLGLQLGVPDLGAQGKPGDSAFAVVLEVYKNLQKKSPQENLKLADEYGRAQTALQNGTDDVYTLVAEYGGCSGAPFRQFYTNLKAFVLARIGDATPKARPDSFSRSGVAQQRAEMASLWYQQAGVPNGKVAELLAGIDTSQPVFKQPLAKGLRIAAWVAKGSSAAMHFTERGTDPKTFPKVLGIDPASHEEWLFEILEPIEVLTAIAALAPEQKSSAGGRLEGAVLFMVMPGWESKMRRVN
jgi:hypothetical protein